MALRFRKRMVSDMETIAPIKLIVVILAMVVFLLAGVLWWGAPDNPHRLRMIAFGLFLWVLSTLLKG